MDKWPAEGNPDSETDKDAEGPGKRTKGTGSEQELLEYGGMLMLN